MRMKGGYKRSFFSKLLDSINPFPNAFISSTLLKLKVLKEHVFGSSR